MVIFIFGATHTGKTVLAQKLLKQRHFPYLSIDHLKMGLIRSGQTELTPESDDEELTAYLWPIVREMAKTAIENNQNLIIEGCYIPFDWKKDFSAEYLPHLRGLCLVFSESYIRNHFDQIVSHASDVEDRGADEDCTMERILAENARILSLCRRHGCEYQLIEEEYNPSISL